MSASAKALRRTLLRLQRLYSAASPSASPTAATLSLARVASALPRPAWRAGGRNVRRQSGPAPPAVSPIAASAASAAEARPAIRVATFNVLAPCYKRLADGRRESEQLAEATQRQQEASVLLQQAAPLDVVALQEYWFHPPVQQLWQQALAPAFHIFALKRPDFPADGLLLCVARHTQVVAQRLLRFNDAGHRCALMLHLRPPPPVLSVASTASLATPTAATDTHDSNQDSHPMAATSQTPMQLPTLAEQQPTAASSAVASNSDPRARDFIAVVTHLTFPHDDTYRAIRNQQASRLVTEIADFAREQEVEHVMLMGDFNGTLSSAEGAVISDAGFRSAYGLKHGRELHVTHRNHLGSSGG